MTEHLRVALKEWDAVCAALGRGRQIVILRKGGIEDAGGTFRLRENRFLLWPTFEHQNKEDIKPEEWTAGRTGGPAQGVEVRFWAEVSEVRLPTDSAALEKLIALSVWTPSFLKKRLAYKPQRPLHAVLLRVFRLPEPEHVPWRDEYEGCVSWVPLAAPVSISGSTPVLDDAAFSIERERLVRLLEGR